MYKAIQENLQNYYNFLWITQEFLSRERWIFSFWLNSDVIRNFKETPLGFVSLPIIYIGVLILCVMSLVCQVGKKKSEN